MTVGDIINDINSIMIDDGGANYLQLHEALGMTGEIMDILIGIIVIAILIGIPVITSFEIAYINLPPLQQSLDIAATKSKSVERLLGVCLRDARLAILKANTIETGESPNVIYFKLRIKTVLIATIVVAILLGPFNIIISYLVSLVQGILDSI